MKPTVCAGPPEASQALSRRRTQWRRSSSVSTKARSTRRGTAGPAPYRYRRADKHVIPLIGKAKLKELRADDVDEWLDGLTEKLSTRTLQRFHAIL
jgi:hypothetical protein